MIDMTQVLRAREWIDSLANGIDPNTGDEMPADTILNDPKIIRGFFHVSDLLRQVAESGGTAKPSAKKVPFYLSLEQRGAVYERY